MFALSWSQRGSQVWTRTDVDSELIEFTLNVSGDILFELLTVLEEFFY